MIYAFCAFSTLHANIVGRKSLDDFRQSVFSPSFMLALQRNTLETLRHEMKYDLFFSFQGGYLIHPSGIGQDFGKCSEKMENNRDYQAVSENCFNNSTLLKDAKIPLFVKYCMSSLRGCANS